MLDGGQLATSKIALSLDSFSQLRKIVSRNHCVDFDLSELVLEKCADGHVSEGELCCGHSISTQGNGVSGAVTKDVKHLLTRQTKREREALESERA